MAKNASFDPAKDIPDQSGKVFFVTGGTTGLGAGFISYIASHNPGHIYFTGRNTDKANSLITQLKSTSPSTKITFIPCDQADLASVQSAAKTFLSQSTRLDVLMCNAGVMALPPSTSKNGYEIQFATNHLSHALLIKLLLPTLLTTSSLPNSDVRIITLTSSAQKSASGIDFATLKTDQANVGPWFIQGKWTRYCQSKLANVMYAQELARRYSERGILSVSVHPGFVHTELHSTETWADKALKFFLSGGGKWTPVEKGADTQTWAATVGREVLVDGAYYEPVGVNEPLGKVARDRTLAEKLWSWTEGELEAYS